MSNITSTVDKISFDVSDIGKPVEVKESYFPNWQVKGAQGPYRLSPNMMVVIPTSKHVTLVYGLTTADWAGRVFTLFGLIGLVMLGLWHGAQRFASGADGSRNGDDGPAGDDDSSLTEHGATGWGSELNDGDGGREPPWKPPDAEPPDRKEPTPALP